MEDQDTESINGNDDYADQRHSFYGQNIASTSSHSYATHQNFHDPEGSLEPDVARFTTIGQFTPNHQGQVLQQTPIPSITQEQQPFTNQFSFISHAFPLDQGVVISKSHIEPWSYPGFPPLPDAILHCLNDIRVVDMPDRHAFDESLAAFLAELGPELRETAAFMPDFYTLIRRCVVAEDMERLSERMRMWLSCHHVCSGSNKQVLLLLPRDDFFHIESSEKESLRETYIARIDRKAGGADRNSTHSTQRDADGSEDDMIFERLPVQPQIYDILVYAHRSHISSISMLSEIRRLGIVRLHKSSNPLTKK